MLQCFGIFFPLKHNTKKHAQRFKCEERIKRKDREKAPNRTHREQQKKSNNSDDRRMKL